MDAGPIQVRHLFEVSPFGNEVSLVQIKGEDLWNVLAKSVREPKVRLEVGGMHVTWSDGKEGPQLVKVTIGGSPLDRERVYELATNSYLATGGDGWKEFSRLGEPVSCGLGVFEASQAALRQAKILKADKSQRFTQVERKPVSY